MDAVEVEQQMDDALVRDKRGGRTRPW